jgi:Domain of unknown function (DUF4126)
MDWPTVVATLGSAWLSGINLYATVLTLGLLQRFGLADGLSRVDEYDACDDLRR